MVMSTRFKPISGMVDQVAGLLFRIQDADNYYTLSEQTRSKGTSTSTSTRAVAAA
jgi:hypothetical protein